MARTNNKSKTAEASASESTVALTSAVAPVTAATPSKKVAKPAATQEAAPAPSSSSSSEEVKSAKAKKTKAAAKSTDVAPIEVAPVVSAPIQVTVTEESSSAEGETPVIEQSLEFLSKLQQLSVLISSLKTEYRVLEKKWTRELKAAQKQNSRRKRKSVNRAPSGFVKPTKISDELANFLGKDKGSEMARTSVTRDINAYIRANKLQDSENGRKINPDAKLSALLKLKTTDELTYFNLQKYMSPHFAKTIKADAVVEASA